MWCFLRVHVFSEPIFTRWWVISGLFWFASFIFSPGTGAPAIFVFGDSLSDVGNAYAAGVTALSPPNYTLGRFTDGPDTVPASSISGVWIEQLAVLLGYPVPTASSAGGGDYAFGGATTGTGGGSTPRLGDQVDQFLQDYPSAPSTAVYVIWGGSGDLLQVTSAGALPAAEATAISNLKSEISQLAAAGAREVIWVDLPPLGNSPDGQGSGFAAQLNDESAKFNSDWAAAITQLKKSFRNLHLTGIDVFTPFQNIQNTPSTYGFTNVTSPALGAAVNPDTYLFWDALHPTTAADAFFANLALQDLKANASAQSITFAPIGNQAVNAAPIALSATSSSGLAVTFSLVSGPATLQGNVLTLTGLPGTVVVEAKQTGNALYQAAPGVSQRFTASRLTATVVLGGLKSVYDLTPKPVTATTTPPDLSVTVTYNGSATPPTNAGTYTVVGTIDDPAYNSTSIRGTEVISKGTAVLTLGNLNTTWTGAAQTATCTTDPPNLPVVLTYNRRAAPPVNAGTYTVTATVDDPNYTGSTTQPLTIAKGTAAITLEIANPLYNGKSHAALAVTTPLGLPVTITYNNSSRAPVNAGTYSVNAQITGPNAQGLQTGVLVITPAPATITLSGLSAVANGKPHAVSASTIPARLPLTITYNGSASPPSAVGTYTVVATIATPNYSGSQTGTLSITPAPSAVPALAATRTPPDGSDVIAQKGDAVPGVEGATFQSFDPPAVNINDHVAFKAILASGPGITPENDFVIEAEDSGGSCQRIAQSGTAAPGVASPFLSFSDPVLNDNEAVAFRATLKAARDEPASGIWSTGNNAQSLALVARSGDQAPGCPAGATFATFSGLVLADPGGPGHLGGVIFLASLTPNPAAAVTATNNTGIWAVDAHGALQLIVRTGDSLDGRTVTALSFLTAETVVDGQDRSDPIVLATFSDLSQATFNVQFP
jgi:phospholipase/lecithinase/hemolysin